jgi:hypothetical protein
MASRLAGFAQHQEHRRRIARSNLSQNPKAVALIQLPVGGLGGLLIAITGNQPTPHQLRSISLPLVGYGRSEFRHLTQIRHGRE